MKTVTCRQTLASYIISSSTQQHLIPSSTNQFSGPANLGFASANFLDKNSNPSQVLEDDSGHRGLSSKGFTCIRQSSKYNSTKMPTLQKDAITTTILKAALEAMASPKDKCLKVETLF